MRYIHATFCLNDTLRRAHVRVRVRFHARIRTHYRTHHTTSNTLSSQSTHLAATYMMVKNFLRLLVLLPPLPSLRLLLLTPRHHYHYAAEYTYINHYCRRSRRTYPLLLESAYYVDNAYILVLHAWTLRGNSWLKSKEGGAF